MCNPLKTSPGVSLALVAVEPSALSLSGQQWGGALAPRLSLRDLLQRNATPGAGAEQPDLGPGVWPPPLTSSLTSEEPPNHSKHQPRE